MKILLICFVWFGLTYSAPAANATDWEKKSFLPAITVEYTVTLSSAMQAALKKFDPDFKIWPASNFDHVLRGIYEYKSFRPDKNFLSFQTPSVVIADFNGDNMPDAAMLGHNKKQGRGLVLLSSPKGYSVLQFPGDPSVGGHDQTNMEIYLEYVEPKKIKAEPSYGRPELDLKNDAFIFGGFEKWSNIYIVKENKLIGYVMSD